MEKDNNWKDQLRNRKIAPSDEAWLAIESGLENKAKNKLNKKYIITLIAASLIGFIVFISLPTTTNTITKPSLVEEVKEQKQTKDEDVVIPENALLNLDAEVTSVEDNNVQSTTTKKTLQKQNLKVEEKLARSEVPTTKSLTKESSTGKETNLKAAALLAEVEAELAINKSQSNFENADQEAEALLAEAQLIIQEVDYDQLYAFAEASDLLAEVEDDLSKDNLQNRVWQFVKSNYENLESAFASLR